jgi:hypothetical protein
MKAYAAKQEGMWSGLACRAWDEFGVQEILDRLKDIIGDVDTKSV